MHAGVWAAVGAFVLWGFLPLYLKTVDHAQPSEILAHRIVWSLLFVLLLLALKRNWRWLADVLKSPKLMATSLGCAVLLSINWLTYIWAVTSGYIIEASLGYFINPLLNVLMGMLFLGERLRSLQWLVLAIAASGVLYMTFVYGQPPWIALILAFSFGFYGLIRKGSPLGSIEGLMLETVVIVPPALIWLWYLSSQGQATFGQGVMSDNLLLAGTGIATALPLILFAYGAKRITLTLLGLLQYIGPSIQLVIGVWLFNEVFDGTKVVGFSLIWLALALYSLEGFLHRRRNAAQPASDR
ncbi:EamA family transporter RarD [Motiliproteus sp.]|uniref:EamA family transporter RarD n=1 Tax=Motiliproteus sp. TaxID=1898955 RepID=UPI003BAB1930